MARPLLRTSGLASVPRDTTGKSWARGLNQFAKGIATGLEKRWEVKKEEENKFISAMDFDINSVSNDLFKGYVVGEYEKFRDNWVELFKEQKGFLTPEQKIMIQSDMNALQKSAEYLNSLSTMNDAAMMAAQKDPRVTYKAEDWEKLLKLMSSDKIDPGAVREAGSLFMQSDANIPGTVLTPMNPDDAFVELAANIRKKLPKEEVGFGVEQLKKGGIRYEVPYTEFSYGSPENLVNVTTGELKKSGFVNNVDKSLMGSLTDEQKKEAILENGNVPGAFSKYYYQNLLPEGVKQEFIGAQRDYSPARRIPDETADGTGGKGWTTVKETDIGWEFGTTPIPITKPIEGETYKNASVVSVKKDPMGNHTALLVVPKGKNESIQEVIETQRQAKGRPLTEQEAQRIQDAMINDDRYKTVEVPLEGIYKELKSGFEKKKVNLEGYGDVSFPEAIIEDEWDQFLRNK